MALHAIVLQQENAEVAARVEKHYSLNYAVNEKCFLVRTDDISEKVANTVGIKGKGDQQIHDAIGVVLKLNGSYAGYASPGIWEWLATEETE